MAEPTAQELEVYEEIVDSFTYNNGKTVRTDDVCTVTPSKDRVTLQNGVILIPEDKKIIMALTHFVADTAIGSRCRIPDGVTVSYDPTIDYSPKSEDPRISG